jgi:hypothetical protein
MCCHTFFSASLKKVTSRNVSAWMKVVKGVISSGTEVGLLGTNQPSHIQKNLSTKISFSYFKNRTTRSVSLVTAGHNQRSYSNHYCSLNHLENRAPTLVLHGWYHLMHKRSGRKHAGQSRTIHNT